MILSQKMGDFIPPKVRKTKLPLILDAGGVALGTVGTSTLFLVTILSLVIYLTRTKRDEIPFEAENETLKIPSTSLK